MLKHCQHFPKTNLCTSARKKQIPVRLKNNRDYDVIPFYGYIVDNINMMLKLYTLIADISCRDSQYDTHCTISF